MSDERQLYLHRRLKHVSMNNWNNTEYIPVVPHYLTNITMSNFIMTYTTSGQD